MDRVERAAKLEELAFAEAIVGFANFLLRLFEAEQPRAVIVGWDTLEVPTYRHKAFPAYQSGRQSDNELLQQFPLLREFVSACASSMRARQAMKPMIFSPRPSRLRGSAA
jgi:5'-3' exonuclease